MLGDIQLSGVAVCVNRQVIDADVCDEQLPVSGQARIARLKDVRAREVLSNALKWEGLALRQLTEPLVPGELKLQKLANGAPYLAGHPDISVSISRSGHASMVGVSTVGRIGVDVERMQSLSFEPMLDMIANSSEKTCVLNDDCEQRFYRVWALKEAVLKALEVGLAGGAKIVRVPTSLIVADGRGNVHTPYGPCNAAVQTDGDIVAAIARYC